MAECKECGTLLESEPYYDFRFRVKDIPRILIEEAEERYEAKMKAGEYVGYYGSRGRLIRIELEKVVLSRLRFWYTEEEVADRLLPDDKCEHTCQDVCESICQESDQIGAGG